VHPEVHKYSSYFVNDKAIKFFNCKLDVSGTLKNGDVIVEAVKECNFVLLSHPCCVTDKVFYMFVCVWKISRVKVPITCFECEFLKAVNVTPSQLHPTRWASVKSFEILCKGIGVTPSLIVFFSFYNTMRRHSQPHSVILKCGCFSLFWSCYKEFKGEDFSVRGNAK